MGLGESIKGLTSKRVRDVPPPAEPSGFAKWGGWSDASDAAARRLDPDESARAQRVSGIEALAQLHAQESERKRADMDARLAGVRRGHRYGSLYE
jgi:hypothetical protein